MGRPLGRLKSALPQRSRLRQSSASLQIPTYMSKERRGWDLNPGDSCEPARFPGVSVQPLRHLSNERTSYGAGANITRCANWTPHPARKLLNPWAGCGVTFSQRFTERSERKSRLHVSQHNIVGDGCQRAELFVVAQVNTGDDASRTRRAPPRPARPVGGRRPGTDPG